MRSYTIRLFFVALLAVAFGLLQAQAKPNFSGTWKLNTGKSDFGAMSAPDTRTGRITHEDPDLKDSFTQSGQMGQVTAEMKYSTGDELAIAGKAQFNGADVTLNDRWSLSADGKTLTIQRHVTSPMGETDRKIVLEKQ
jgi:hypothetical protein